MNTKALLTLLAFGAWSAGSWWFYSCQIKGFCPGEAVQTSTAPVAAKPTINPAELSEPLMFRWADAEPIARADFDAFRDSIVKTISEGEALQITGYFFEGEGKPGNFANMGLARAEAVRKMFQDKLPADRIQTTAREVPFRDELKTSPFLGCDFGSLTRNAFVEETADSIVIYFPSGSAQKEQDAAVDKFLEKLAKRLKQTKERLSITGHSDNKGDEALNKRLAQKRADGVLALLVKKGADKKRLSVKSEGEKHPVADNNTEAGRGRNRRVVVRLVR